MRLFINLIKIYHSINHAIKYQRQLEIEENNDQDIETIFIVLVSVLARPKGHVESRWTYR